MANSQSRGSGAAPRGAAVKHLENILFGLPILACLVGLVWLVPERIMDDILGGAFALASVLVLSWLLGSLPLSSWREARRRRKARCYFKKDDVYD